jgi:hypothetical protein
MIEMAADSSKGADPPALGWLAVSLVMVALAYEPNFAHGYINYNESGQHLAAIAELARGSLLFRDIFVQYGPLHYYIPLGAFEALGYSIATLRGYFLVGEIAGLLAAYALAREVIGRRFLAGVAGIALVVLSHHPFWSTRWGGWRFAFVYLAVLALLRFSRTRRAGWMIASGVSTALAFLHTYDAAAAAGAGALAYLVFEWAARRDFSELTRTSGLYAVGIAATLLPFAIFLFATDTVGDFWRQLPLANPGRAWLQPFGVEDLSSTILFPAGIFLLSIGMVIREAAGGQWREGRTLGLVVLVSSGGLLYASAFRAIRGPQFETSLPIAVILAVYWLGEAWTYFEAARESPQDRLRGGLALAGVVLGILAFGLADIRAYAGGPLAWGRYQLNKAHWVPRHVGADVLNDDFRVIAVEGAGRARVPGWQAEEIEGITAYVVEALPPGEPLFAYPDLGIFNYFAKRPHITRFQIPILAAASPAWSEELMDALREKRAGVALVGKGLSTVARATRHTGEYLPEAQAFILANYTLAGKIGRVYAFRLEAEE